MRSLKHFAACVLLLTFSSLSWGQNGGTPPAPGTFSQVNLPLLASLPPVSNANTALVGNPGNSTYYYWLVTNYTLGQSSPQGPFAVTNAPAVLSGLNYITITPQYLPGATVDVLRTTSLAPPTGTGFYAVATGNTSGTINDQGGSLGSYTIAPVTPQNFGLSMANEVVGSAQSHLILRQNGIFVADLSAASGGGITGPTANGGLIQTSTTLGLNTAGCASTNVYAFNGTTFGCAAAGGGTTNNSSQYSLPYYSSAGTANVLSGVAPPATNGNWILAYNVTANTAVAPAMTQAGVAARAVVGTTATDTILYSDNTSRVAYQGSVTVAASLPTPTTLGNLTFATRLSVANGSPNVTVTPAGGFQIGGASTLTIVANESCLITVDSSGAFWNTDCANFTAGGGSGTVSPNSGTAGAFSNYAAAGGSTTVGPDANLIDAGGFLVTAEPLELANGTAANPTLVFANGTTFGLLSASASEIGISNGTNILVAFGSAGTAAETLNSAGILCWVSTTNAATGTRDTCFSRVSAGLIGVGTGGAGSTAGSLSMTSLTLSTALSIGNGGTGQVTANAGFNALAPLTTLGDIVYENATPVAARLAGNTTSTKNFLIQTGTGTVSAAPQWGTIAAGDVPTLNQSTSGSAASLSATLSVGTGGTGLANPTVHDLMIAEGSSAFNLLACGVGTTLQGASAADPTCTATVTLGVQNTTQGTLTLAGSAATAGQLILGIAGASALASTIAPGVNTGATVFTLPIGTGTAETIVAAAAALSNHGICLGSGGGYISCASTGIAASAGVAFTTYNSIATAGSGVAALRAAPAAIVTGSGTSIGSTSLCAAAVCPAGMYTISVYLEVTTACTTTGTYQVNIIYTDDQGSKTIVAPLVGTGVVSSVLGLAATANYGQATFPIYSTGGASINYSTTAGACGSGGPMVGKMYISAANAT
jgi:trimeric autotransporter adhesin